MDNRSERIDRVFSYIAAASAPIYAFFTFSLLRLRTIFFPSHWLFAHITIDERAMNPVTTATINPWKEF